MATGAVATTTATVTTGGAERPDSQLCTHHLPVSSSHPLPPPAEAPAVAQESWITCHGRMTDPLQSCHLNPCLIVPEPPFHTQPFFSLPNQLWERKGCIFITWVELRAWQEREGTKQ